MDTENVTKFYSMEEVRKHDNFTNIDGTKSYWIAIHNKVYDVTKWLDDHPGGEDILVENSGTDATEPWDDIGHSKEAREKMKQYLIGEIRPGDRKNRIDKGPPKWASTDNVPNQPNANENVSTDPNKRWNLDWMVALGILVIAYYYFWYYF